MLSPNAMNLVKRSVGSGGVMVIENEQELASDVESAVQTTVDVPIGNAAMLVVDGEESNVERTGSSNIYNALPAR